MTADVQQILHTFDTLPDVDKQVLVAEIVRRSLSLNQPPISDQALLEVADEQFQRLDRDESADG